MLKHRLISFTILLSLFFTIVFCSNFYISTIAAAILALPMSFFAVYEFLKMTENIGYGGFKKTGGWLAVIFTSWFVCLGTFGINLNNFIAVVIAIFWLIILKNIGDKEKIKRVLFTLAAFFMVMLPLSLLYKYLFTFGVTSKVCLDFSNSDFEMIFKSNRMMLLYIILVTKAGDTGAYCTGMLCNKISGGKNHPVVPKVSPKKSVEGVIGGIVLSVAVSYLLYFSIPQIKNYIPLVKFGENIKIVMTVIIPLFYGLVLYFGGFFGDLVESSLKRTCGVKDSGNILPGMGGVLDVVDSLLIALPIFFLAEFVVMIVGMIILAITT